MIYSQTLLLNDLKILSTKLKRIYLRSTTKKGNDHDRDSFFLRLTWPRDQYDMKKKILTDIKGRGRATHLLFCTSAAQHALITKLQHPVPVPVQYRFTEVWDSGKEKRDKLSTLKELLCNSPCLGAVTDVDMPG